MKAWQTKDGILQFADVPEPAPAADQILLQVHAISLNRGEVRGSARAAEGVVVVFGNSSDQDTTFNARSSFLKGAATICSASTRARRSWRSAAPAERPAWAALPAS